MTKPRAVSNITRRSLLLGTIAGGLTLGLKGHAQESQVNSGEPQPVNAVNGVLDAFDRFPVVALGEAHGWQEFHDFVQQLVRHPDFATKVDCIVVEFGNARYQSLMDRFIAGREPVSVFELRKVWRNTTQGAWNTWDDPIYEQFFRAVRSVNRSLQKGQRRIRVLLGDPPVDWQTSEALSVQGWFVYRDKHFADVVTREVLEKNRKALLIAGFGHTSRALPAVFTDETMIDLLDKQYPGKVFGVLPHAPFSALSLQLESRLINWSTPSLAVLGDNWLGRTPAAVLDTESSQFKTPGTLAQAADAYLYLGPGRDMTASQTDPAVFRDPVFAKELTRRRKLLGLDKNDQFKDLGSLEQPGIRYFPKKP
jgi:hypothetical protein